MDDRTDHQSHRSGRQSPLVYLLGAGMTAVAAIGLVRGPSRAAADPTNLNQPRQSGVIPSDALIAQTVAIRDAQGTGLDAYTILAPKNWTTKAAVLWDAQRAANPSDLFVTVADPTGSERFVHEPSLSGVWSPQYSQFRLRSAPRCAGALSCVRPRAPSMPSSRC